LEVSKFGKLLTKIREDQRYSMNALAEAAGVSVAHISRIESGERPDPSARFIKKLTSVVGHYEELMQAAGYLVNPEENGKPNYVITESSNSVPINVLPVKSENLHMIPVVGKVSAGIGVYAEDDIEEYWPLDISLTNIYGNDLTRYFYLHVKGDSMEPLINNGDLVLVLKGPVEDGDVAVVIVNRSEGCVKKVRFHSVDEKRFVTLMSYNFNYPPKTYAADECHIAGKIVWRSGYVKW